jgi:hypothetical protein
MVWYRLSYGLVSGKLWFGRVNYGLVWSMNSTKMIQFDIRLHDYWSWWLNGS